jgi:predicted N-acetyltransferase YhbS
MQVVNLNTSTPYSEVIALATADILNGDFEFTVDPQGAVESLYLYYPQDRVLMIEVDDHLLMDLHGSVKASPVVTEEITTVFHPLMTRLDLAA